VPTSRLIREIGDPVGTFSRFFPDKASLVRRLLRDSRVEWEKRIEKAVQTGGDIADRLEQTITAMIVVAIEHYGPLANLYFHDPVHLADVADAVATINASDFEMIYDLVREGVDQGVFACRYPESATTAIVGAFHAMVAAYAHGSRQPAIDKAARATAHIFLGGLKRSPTTQPKM
jgi:AcrR family transcriptional regulator